MWNEELRSNSMKGSGPEVSKDYELPGDGAASTLATPFSVSSNLFGLTGLCDQITSISSTDLSTSSKDQPLKSPGSYHNNCPNPVLSNSHLGSALHSSVARSFSDSTKHDRLRNAYPFAEPSTFSSSRGWPVDHNARAGGTGSFNSLHVSKSHNEVSRSQSDHVSSNSEQPFLQVLKMPAGYPNDYESLQNLYKSKVIFALKLGYSETMLQSALRKVGLHSGENQLLEELIALQKMKPQALDVSEPLMGKLPLEERGSSFSIRSDSGVDVSEKESDLLPIVIDGSNVAMSHGNKERFSCKGIRICVDWFLQRGHRDITVFVPMWRKESPKADNPISEQHILGELQKENLLAFTPSRQVSGRRYVCHDDRYILNLASETGAIVVSNDNYRDLVNDKPDYKKVIEERVLMYTFVNDRFMPPDDPLGRGGPSLEVFLRKPKPAVVTQLCPYEKKCTYGYKCKFYHPERISQPQKSISDTLKENSNRKIYEVRSRSPTSSDVMGDPLSRTQSMQPNETRFPMKKALSRTKSLNPNLERAMMQTHLQSQTLWNQQFEQERAGIVMHRQHTVNPEAIPPLHQTIIDTSVPPPPCLSWQRFDASDLMGLHPKLERQLTLNPVADPRIHVTSVSREPTIHDTFAYPPPVIANLRQLHSPVKRNSSAPEVNTATGAMSRSPVPALVHMDPDLSTVQINTQMAINCSPIHYRQPVGPGVIGDRLIPHHPIGDLQLCKSKSE